MIELLQIILLTSIWCLGVTIVTQPDMALGRLREWAEGKESMWFQPLLICPWCLPSIHSIFGYLFSLLIGVEITWKIIAIYPLVVAGASVVTGLIWSLCTLIFIKTKHFTNIEQMSYFDLKDRKRIYSSNPNNFKN
ncbi:MAG: hypothetical protein KA290_10675 [Chitinophagaceae bacterium]|nr:hypothetical protein [Chitinophagaceae bacterium]